VSVRRACATLGIDRSLYAYRSKRGTPAELNPRIKEICETRMRYGYRRVHILLRREGWGAIQSGSIAFTRTWACSRAVMRVLLTHRRNLEHTFLDLENAIRQSLKSFGIKLGGTSRGKFDQAVREAVADDPLSSELTDAKLSARAARWEEYCRLLKKA